MKRFFWGLALVAMGCSEDNGNLGAGGFVVPGMVCIDFCDQVVEQCAALQFPLTQCQNNCQRDVDAAFAESEGCGDAFEAFYECVSALSCAEVEEWRDADASADEDYPCRAEVDAANDACDP